ncbi:hypothetical protein [Haloferax sp. YSMS24]|uniref:hypothetical protein n=1 Tax=Haloferax sp. YSMS24 TaxID=3388425 RepID=UPI00398CCE97
MMKKISWHRVGPEIAGLTGHINILFIFLLLFVLIGNLLTRGPVLRFVAFIFGGLVFSSFVGFMVVFAIEGFTKSRWLIQQWWNRNTPPHINQEISGLPVLDDSMKVSVKKVRKYTLRGIAVYLIMMILSVYISVERPEWVLVVNHPILNQITVLAFTLFLQIPAELLSSQLITEVIPAPSTPYDAVVRVLIIVGPLPLLSISMANADYALERMKRRFYAEVVRKTENSDTLSDAQVAVVFLDVLSFLFILLFLYSSL